MAVTTDKLLMKFGVTQAFDCNYIPEQKEQLLVYVDDEGNINKQYEQLIKAGFRRSGEQIYRPHCVDCDACQSLRILSQQYTPSRSQKRIINKNKALHTEVQTEIQDNYYPLYARYIEQRHSDGSMFPPSVSQFQNFVQCSWNKALFLEAWDVDNLVAVSVIDEMTDAISALYTFFEPSLSHRSMGSYMIIQLIHHANLLSKSFVYLGYQVDRCNKMNYKQNYYPHERFYQNKWHLKVKKTD
jgi:arginine-tRNA-protein transferase